MTAAAGVAVERASLDAILALREAYRRQMACQIVHDSWHERGFTDTYLLRVAGATVGYGAVAGDPRGPREIVREFFVQAAHRASALPLFRALVAASGARCITAQTNDRLLTLMLLDCATDLRSDTILFADAGATQLSASGAVLRRVTDADRAAMFPHTREPVGEWGIEANGTIVATGGLMFHYNPPYGDIYMEVAATYQRMGYGSYLVQELKRLCSEMDRVPAARCGRDNVASRRTLERAGMLPCAHIVTGTIVR